MKNKQKLRKLIIHLILLSGIGVVIFPFLWMVLTSFKATGEAMQIPPYR